ncbi:MAG: hypothetical protein RRY97_09630, partial [Oscillibacter sp.]
MLIDEKGLVKAIKEAYAHNGYNVLNAGRQAIIYADEWFIRCDWNILPRKALAIIVEHMGLIPGDGDTVSITKGGDPQVIMSEVVGQDIDGWTTGEPFGAVTMVPVMFRGLQLYQEVDGHTCYGVDPLPLAIIERALAAHIPVEITGGNQMVCNTDGEMVAIAIYRKAAYCGQDWERDVWTAMESVDLHSPKEG